MIFWDSACDETFADSEFLPCSNMTCRYLPRRKYCFSYDISARFWYWIHFFAVKLGELFFVMKSFDNMRVSFGPNQNVFGKWRQTFKHVSCPTTNSHAPLMKRNQISFMATNCNLVQVRSLLLFTTHGISVLSDHGLICFRSGDKIPESNFFSPFYSPKKQTFVNFSTHEKYSEFEIQS